MNHFKIGIVVGSLRKDSYNKQTANALTKLFPKEFAHQFIDISNLPLYNQDDDNHTPSAVIKIQTTHKRMSRHYFLSHLNIIAPFQVYLKTH
ncbi:chromate reductase (NADPH-dependent FMN reductase) [Proteus vulgaris]|nr:chromate reductase (NADPH-dependent FMN reductase) [Proteus vulgaris]